MAQGYAELGPRREGTTPRARLAHVSGDALRRLVAKGREAEPSRSRGDTRGGGDLRIDGRRDAWRRQEGPSR